MQLQEIVDQEAEHSLTMSSLVMKLEKRGVKVIPNMAGNGRVSGISFDLNGEIMKGSDLGKRYTFLGLQKQGILYDTFSFSKPLDIKEQQEQGKTLHIRR